MWVDPDAPGIHFRIDDDDSPVSLRGTWEVQAQGLLLIDLCFSGRGWEEVRGLDDLLDPPRPLPPVHISTTVLRKVSVPELERRTREAIRRRAHEEAGYEQALEQARELGYDIRGIFEPPRAARTLVSQIGEQLRPGRDGYPVGLYVWVAKEYLRLVQRGDRPVHRLLARRASEHLGRTVTPENVRDWVRRARELELLSPGVRGKAVAMAGPALPAGQARPALRARSDG